MIDLLVAGGGPAGLAAALYAAHRGLEVIVHEPRIGAIDKACGEGLMPGAVAALAELDIEPIGHHLRGIRYVSGSRHAEASFRDGPGLGVRRTTLHASMRQAVDAAGITVIPKSVASVTPNEHGVLVDGVRARYLIAADGLHSPIRRNLGLRLSSSSRKRYGLRRHIEISPWTQFVEVHWSPLAEAYVTPVGADLVGIAVLTGNRASFDEHIEAFPALRRRIAGVPWSAVLGAGPLKQRSRRRVAGRVLLVGDASGYVDALTGEGIALGMAQARAAVAAISAGKPHTYEKSWRRITWRYELLTRTLISTTSVAIGRRAIVPLAAAHPGVFAAAVNLLADPATQSR